MAATYFYGTRYMLIEKEKTFMVNECFANVTIMESALNEADSQQHKIMLYYEYDLDSIISDDIYATEDGLLTTSIMDYTLNYTDLTTTEAEELMNSIADGDFMDCCEEDYEEDKFNKLIDEAYDRMEMDDMETMFANIQFVPANKHVSAWSYCCVCDVYGHSEVDH